MKPPNQERSPKGQKARRRNEFQMERERLLLSTFSQYCEKVCFKLIQMGDRRQTGISFSYNLFKITALYGLEHEIVISADHFNSGIHTAPF